MAEGENADSRSLDGMYKGFHRKILAWPTIQYNPNSEIIGVGSRLAVSDSNDTLPSLSSVVSKKEHIRVVFGIIPQPPNPWYSSWRV
jgi:hypothetical protein